MCIKRAERGNPMSESVKVRITGTKPQVELLTEQLRDWSKQWGKKKIFRVKRYDRQKNGHINKYHLTFGARRFVNYIEMKLPRIPSKLKGKVELTYINPDGTKESELVSIEKARKEFQKEWGKQKETWLGKKQKTLDEAAAI